MKLSHLNQFFNDDNDDGDGDGGDGDDGVGVSVNWEAEFAGEGSYIELTKRLLPHSREAGDEEIIKMTVTTDVDDALLFWQGQTPTISGRGKDYIAIAVENGYPVFRLSINQSINHPLCTAGL